MTAAATDVLADAESEASPEVVAAALSGQLRRAVELLVTRFGHADAGIAAHEIYRDAVTVVMRVVFLLFAADRKLLPSDGDGVELAAELDRFPWRPVAINDRTVLDVLRAVRYVELGTGSARQRRRVPFGRLDVEQLGHLYEGLLSHDARRAQALRRSTGTHYTPRDLAEQIVEGALEPLVHSPGPLDTADEDGWRLRSSREILSLKVADIAMGSAAFLLAAARYLGAKLAEAWRREGVADPDVVEARRQVIGHCLYGADVDETAVELAKLSLWLLAADPRRPYAFLDHRLVAGDALLGITSVEQPAHPAGSRAHLLADLTIGAALHHAGRGPKGLAAGTRAAAELAGRIDTDEPEVRRQAQEWLDADLPGSAGSAGSGRRALHWPLAFPEVFAAGGFDAIVGNPPFLGGQKLSGALGSAYREYLVHAVGSGVRGSADLVAYFVLRAHQLLNATGQTGLIATNTLAQGDTREVGLDQLVAGGVVIRRSVKSRPWPSPSAVLEYCAVWTTKRPPGPHAPVVADGVPVARITPSLDPGFRVSGPALRLAGNAGRSFQGSNILGLGFTLDPDEAKALIERDRRNADVLFPYLNGQDLTSRPDCSASRWVINFHDWPEERARTYPECYERAHRLVRPERATNGDRQRRELWWRFTRPTTDLYRAIAGLGRVIVITRVSKAVAPVMVPTGQVISEALVVFATNDPAMLAVLSSAAHLCWATSRGSTLETRVRYTPSDVFETFPLPEPTARLRELGERLDTFRRDVMLARGCGLTRTYNLVSDPACADDDIEALRRIHRAIDEATIRAYGWTERVAAAGGLDHGFHRTGRDPRYTIGPAARRELLDSLLELNHERHAAS